MVQTEVLVRPFVLIALASQPYCRLSPSWRSATRTRSLDSRLSFKSIEHEEKSVWVKQLFLITWSVPRTALSDILNIDRDNKSTSGFKTLPVHSTSCRLWNPLKSRVISPGINPQILFMTMCHLKKKKAHYWRGKYLSLWTSVWISRKYSQMLSYSVILQFI